LQSEANKEDLEVALHLFYDDIYFTISERDKVRFISERDKVRRMCEKSKPLRNALVKHSKQHISKALNSMYPDKPSLKKEIQRGILAHPLAALTTVKQGKKFQSPDLEKVPKKRSSVKKYYNSPPGKKQRK
jgi:hypothetical protein